MRYRAVVLVYCILLCLGICSCQNYSDVLKFNSWFRTIDRTPRKNLLEIGPSPYSYGVFPTQPLAPGDVILKVDMDWVICVETARKYSKIPSYEDMDELEYLTLFLVEQRLLKSKSRWADWIRVLPTQFTLPTFWTDQEVNELNGDPKYKAAIEAERRNWHKRYSDIVAGYERQNMPLPKVFTRSLYMWGSTVLCSRAWHLRGRMYLVPVADFFNYRAAKPVSENHQFRGESFMATHAIEGDMIVLKSDRSCAAGSELFESYGDSPNQIFLQYLGFVPDNNPDNCVELDPPLFSPAVDTYSSRGRLQQYLSNRMGLTPKHDYDFNCVRHPKHTHEGALRAHLLAAIRVREMDIDALRLCQNATSVREGSLDFYTFFKACGIPAGTRPGTATEGNVVMGVPLVLRDWAHRALSLYPTTLKQDLVAAARATPTESPHVALARRYRIERKAILQLLATNEYKLPMATTPTTPPPDEL